MRSDDIFAAHVKRFADCASSFHREVFTGGIVCAGLFCCPGEGHHMFYRNVLPEAVYVCFARTTLFTKLCTYLYDQS